jgi:transcriptional regulator with XRE-family HTH domain
MIDLHQIALLLGGRIRILRKKMGMKQSQFAQMVGMSRDAIGLIERGEKLPRLESIYKIVDKLNIPLSRILDFDKTMQEEKKSTRDPLSSLNFYLKAKSPADVQMLHDIARNILDKDQASDTSYRAHSVRSKKQRAKSFIMRDK